MFGIFSDLRFFKFLKEKTNKEKHKSRQVRKIIGKNANTAQKSLPPQKRGALIRIANSEAGNIFFTLFGAVMIVGMLGTVVVATMRGPLSTMVTVQSRTRAESEMSIASRLVLLEATQLPSSGDCDGDGFVEPLEYVDAGGNGPVGGGFLPGSIASSHVDPWGMQYGYCSWDAGDTNGVIACDVDGTGSNERLNGNGVVDDETYTIVAIISAGPDQRFDTSCIGGVAPSISKGGDDLVVEYTYAGATTATGGLWNLKSGDATTAEIGKNLEVTGGASFTEGIDLTASTIALQLGAASMLYPDETTLSTCNAANDGLVRINTTEDPDILELCDDPNGWVSIGGSLWEDGADDDIYYNTGTPQVGIGTNNPDDTLDVAGTAEITGNTVIGGALDVAGNTGLSGALGVTGISSLSTLNVSGATTLAGTLNAQGDISDSGGDVTIDDNLVVTGTSDLQGNVANSIANLILDDDVDVSGVLDAQGSIIDTTGNLHLNDNTNITGSLDVSINIDGVDITASGDLDAGSNVIVNGDTLGPPDECLSTEKLEWNTGSGWSCETDLQGAGGGTPELDDLDDVTAAGAADGDCITYDNSTSTWVLDTCSGSTVTISGLFENVATVVRVKAAAGDYATDDFVFGSPQLADDGDADHERRMFFDKSKAAFRAGTASGNHWDDANVGSNSFAGGASSIASGDRSTAFGGSATASGQVSFAAGYHATASGYLSTAMGTSTTASGQWTTAIGHYAVANGGGSMAIGLFDNNIITTAIPTVSGAQSLGIFMDEQDGIDLAAANTLGLFGGTMIIDPAIPATELATSTGGEQDLELDVTGDIGAVNYCDEDGNNCFTAGAVTGGLWTDLGASRIHYGDIGTEQVGIGTSNPQAMLDVAGGVRVGSVTGSTPTFMALDDLSDVSATGPTDGDCIVYNNGTGDWESGSCAAAAASVFEIDTNVIRVRATVADYATDDFVVGSPQLNDDGDATHDNRMFFDKSKGAFRAGTAIDARWDDANVGDNSVALGRNTTASGDHSAVTGYYSTASGYASFAAGNMARSTGGDSIALGANTTASGYTSVALGRHNVSSGYASTTIGRYADASGDASIAMGLIDNAYIITTNPVVSGIQSVGMFMGDQDGGVDMTADNTLGLFGGTMVIDPNIPSTELAASTGGEQDLELDVTGDIGAANYCDEDGNNCFTAASASGGNSDIFEVTGAVGSEVVSSIDANVPYATADFVFGSATLDDNLGTTDDNYRMFFDKSKGAFRAGNSGDSNYWDDARVGVQSFAGGSFARAEGANAVALGPYAAADGSPSVAIGWLTSASGMGSLSMGRATNSSGISSTAMGQEATASGNNSMAIGLGDPTTNAIVSGASSLGIFMGDQTAIDVASANTMAVLGGDLIVGSYQLDDTTTGNQDNRMFFDTSKGAFRAGSTGDDDWDDANVGTNSFASGSENIASGTASAAFGSISSASGIYSFAAGRNAGASGNTGIALGHQVRASGYASVALGESTAASNTFSTAMGNETIASGEGSFAVGLIGSGAGIVTRPTVSGDQSMGIFMGAQDGGVDIVSANTVALLGGTMVIDPNIPATELAASTGGVQDLELDVEGDIGAINYCDEDGNNCFTASSVSSGAGSDIFEVTGAAGFELVSSIDANVPYATADFVFGAPTLDYDANVDHRHRMFFNKAKAAFRAGSSSTFGGWDDANVGDESVAFGVGSQASGRASFATGEGSTASANFSFAAGNNATASGVYAAAFGGWTEADGGSSFAAGFGGNATGERSVALGSEADASGNYSMAFGLGVPTTTDPIVSGASSLGIFMGDQDAIDVASANTMAVLGGDLIVGSYQLDDTGTGNQDYRMFFDVSKGAFRAGQAIGNHWDAANVGTNSFATGWSTRAPGNYSIATGYNSNASGESATAMGRYSVASGSYSTAIGQSSDATGTSSTAMGQDTTASGRNATTMGQGTTASGIASAAMGRYAIAGSGTATDGAGDGSVAFGLIDDAVTITTRPMVTGIQSVGIFMGDQDGGVDVSADNTLALLGGTMVIDPNIPATELAASTGGVQDLELDVEGDIGAINYCDEDGNNCFTAATAAAGSLWTDNTDYINYENVRIYKPGTTLNHADSDQIMFFDADSQSLRGGIGGGSGTDWDEANIGSRSIAWGTWVLASGSNSIAVGAEAHATGSTTTALGYHATASGTYSSAIGNDVTASGHISTARGNNTTASGQYSTTLGMDVTASGANSMAIGLGDATTTNPAVSGDSSIGFFMGDQTGVDLANANTMAVLGGDLVVGSYQLDDTATGNEDIRMFYDASKGAFRVGDASSTQWDDANVGSSSFASGSDTTSSGFASTATGNATNASGNSSFTAGFGTIASGAISAALGRSTTASGLNSTALGREAIASGDYSVAFGLGDAATIAPEVVGDNSFGIFMGDQSSIDITASNTMAVLGGDFIVGSYQLDDTTTGTHDHRMFYDASKGAFRAGVTTGAQWDDANVGSSSVAFGGNTTATGLYSSAFGGSTIAGGNYSTAMGSGTVAYGYRATSMGSGTSASGDSSTAMGQGTAASGIASTAIGNSAVAGSGTAADGSGDGSVAFGLIDDAVTITTKPMVTGIQSVGMFMGDQDGIDMAADNTLALLGGKMVIDPNVPATELAASTGGVQDLELDVEGDIGAINYCDEDGNNCFTAASVASGSGVWEVTATTPEVVRPINATAPHDTADFLFGSTTLADTGDATDDARVFFDKSKGAFRAGQATGTEWDDANIGNGSLASGYNTTASSDNSTAFGSGTTASGDNSTATGNATTASGWNSTAMGYKATASNNVSTSIGNSTTASGTNSTAIGSNATASGSSSTALGEQTTASGIYSTAIGYNAVAGSGTAADGAGDGSVAFGLIDDAVTITTKPMVTGIQSVGMFMGDQDGVDMAADNTLALLGGTMVIDPAIPATNLAASTGGEQDLELDVAGDIGAINYCDADGNNCFTAASVGGGSSVFEVTGAALSEVVSSVDSTAPYATADFVFGSPTLADAGTAAHDSRMFFDKSKSAFRAGQAQGTEWDDANIGSFSFASGRNSTASSTYSTAMGFETTASGSGSSAIGYSTTASGSGSTAMGQGTTASGDYSTAIGGDATSSGELSTAIGVSTTASGTSSTAIGQEATASGVNSMAVGLGNQTAGNTVVSGDNSMGIFLGDQAAAIDVATANTMAVLGGDLIVGSYQLDDTATGNQDNRMFFDVSKGAFRAGEVAGTEWDAANVGANSFATGVWTIASGNTSTAMGNEAEASGDYSTAIGSDTTASGNYATAMGRETTASMIASTATGSYTTASGGNSTAMGTYTTASGSNSTAMGNSTTASGLSATAMGRNTIASGITSTAIGYNVVAGSGTAADGNGDGSLAVGLIDDTVTITVKPTVTGIQSAGFFMGDQDGVDLDGDNIFAVLGGNVIIDPTIPATVTDTSYALQVVGDAAKDTGSSWSASSDARLKDIHGEYEKGLDEIMALRPVKFSYKKDNARHHNSEAQHVGFIAQEVDKVFPEAVDQKEDGYLDFNMHPVNVAMVGAVQDLKAENDNLKAALDKMQASQKQTRAALDKISKQVAVLNTAAGENVGKASMISYLWILMALMGGFGLSVLTRRKYTKAA